MCPDRVVPLVRRPPVPLVPGPLVPLVPGPARAANPFCSAQSHPPHPLHARRRAQCLLVLLCLLLDDVRCEGP